MPESIFRHFLYLFQEFTMALRFRKRVKVFPGFYVNLSGSGISTTVGVKGASINFSSKGTYLNTGIPGTGLYSREKIGGGRQGSSSSHGSSGSFVPSPSGSMSAISEVLEGAIKSSNTQELTSSGMREMKETLLEAYKERQELSLEVKKAKNQLLLARLLHITCCVLVFGFFLKQLKNKVNEKKEYLNDVEQQLQNCFVDIDIHFEQAVKGKYERVVSTYNELLKSEKIWDVTSSVYNDRKVSRSAASSTITRRQVKFKYDNIDIIKSSYPALHFENANGGDLYIYPAFVIIVDDKKNFALIGLNEFRFSFATQRFIERESIPRDTQIVDYTWEKVNKNGQPDKRFKDNPKLPIVKYGEVELNSSSGLNEAYAFSSYEKSESFASAFKAYQSGL
jgi:hypothetical protein